MAPRIGRETRNPLQPSRRYSAFDPSNETRKDCGMCAMLTDFGGLLRTAFTVARGRSGICESKKFCELTNTEISRYRVGCTEVMQNSVTVCHRAAVNGCIGFKGVFNRSSQSTKEAFQKCSFEDCFDMELAAVFLSRHVDVR